MIIQAAIERVRQFRVRSGLTAPAFARKAGLHSNALRDIDNPEWSPNATTLRKLESFIEGQEISRQASGKVA